MMILEVVCDSWFIKCNACLPNEASPELGHGNELFHDIPPVVSGQTVCHRKQQTVEQVTQAYQ